MNFDWLIVGGGLHGVHLALVLQRAAGVPAERLVIVDPGTRLLERWRQVTDNTGMAFLRSPGVHHLDLDPWSLHRFAEAPAGRGRPPRFTPPYDRPATSMFAEHCAMVIDAHRLQDRHLRGRVAEVALREDGVVVDLEDGLRLRSERVLLAPGMSDQPHWPEEATRLRAAGAEVQHVLQPGYLLQPAACRARVAVIGAGITGAQVALRLAAAGREVTLVSRHPLRRHQFDSDPGWIGPRFMHGFHREPSMARRRDLIRAARHRGSLPPDVHQETLAAVAAGRLRWRLGSLAGAAPAGGAVDLQLDDGPLQVDQLLLATGFDPQRPGGAWVDRMVSTFHLPCAPCGYPIVDRHLRWHPRLFVTGALAELELGPTARNITGARRAGERLWEAARAARAGEVRGAA